MTIIITFNDGSKETYNCQTATYITVDNEKYLEIIAPSGHSTRIAAWGISNCKINF